MTFDLTQRPFEQLQREVDKRRIELAEKQGWAFLTYSTVGVLQGVHPNHGDRMAFECASCPIPSLRVLLETDDLINAVAVRPEDMAEIICPHCGCTMDE